MRGESKQSVHTSLLFCTVGVLLRIFEGDLAEVLDVVLVDEVHERTAENDLLLLTLRHTLLERRKEAQRAARLRQRSEAGARAAAEPGGQQR